MVAKFLVRKEPLNECQHFGNVFWFVGRSLKLITWIFVSLKTDGWIDWEWSRVLWPIWLGCALLASLGAVSLMMLISSATSLYSNQSTRIDLIGSTWFFFVTVGGTVAFSMSFSSISNHLDGSKEAYWVTVIPLGIYIIIFVSTTYHLQRTIIVWWIDFFNLRQRDPVNDLTQEDVAETDQIEQINPPKKLLRMTSTYFLPSSPSNQKHVRIQSEFVNEPSKEHRRIASFNQTVIETGHKLCVICSVNQPNAVLMKCGHGGMCFQCGERLRGERSGCPLCRARITMVLEIADDKDDYFNVVRHSQQEFYSPSLAYLQYSKMNNPHMTFATRSAQLRQKQANQMVAIVGHNPPNLTLYEKLKRGLKRVGQSIVNTFFSQPGQIPEPENRVPWRSEISPSYPKLNFTPKSQKFDKGTSVPTPFKENSNSKEKSGDNIPYPKAKLPYYQADRSKLHPQSKASVKVQSQEVQRRKQTAIQIPKLQVRNEESQFDLIEKAKQEILEKQKHSNEKRENMFIKSVNKLQNKEDVKSPQFGRSQEVEQPVKGQSLFQEVDQQKSIQRHINTPIQPYASNRASTVSVCDIQAKNEQVNEELFQSSPETDQIQENATEKIQELVEVQEEEEMKEDQSPILQEDQQESQEQQVAEDKLEPVVEDTQEQIEEKVNNNQEATSQEQAEDQPTPQNQEPQPVIQNPFTSFNNQSQIKPSFVFGQGKTDQVVSQIEQPSQIPNPFLQQTQQTQQVANPFTQQAQQPQPFETQFSNQQNDQIQSSQFGNTQQNPFANFNSNQTQQPQIRNPFTNNAQTSQQIHSPFNTGGQQIQPIQHQFGNNYENSQFRQNTFQNPFQQSQQTSFGQNQFQQFSNQSNSFQTGGGIPSNQQSSFNNPFAQQQDQSQGGFQLGVQNRKYRVKK